MLPTNVTTPNLHNSDPLFPDTGKGHGGAPGLYGLVTNPTTQHEIEQVYEWEQEADAEAAARLAAARTPESPGLPGMMSAESLVAYCECRLDSLGSQMQRIFNQQQINANATSAIDNVASDLNDLPPPNTDSPPTVSITGDKAAEIQADYQAAINAANVNGPTQLGQQLEHDLETFQSNFTGSPVTGPCSLSFGGQGTSYSVNSTAISGLSNSLKTYASNLNSSSQDQMIQLQSFIQDQQTVVQMSTNFLNSVGQEGQNIAANCKG
jgi:hypothetical protein